jgi:hypothetical protein
MACDIRLLKTRFYLMPWIKIYGILENISGIPQGNGATVWEPLDYGIGVPVTALWY